MHAGNNKEHIQSSLMHNRHEFRFASLAGLKIIKKKYSVVTRYSIIANGDQYMHL